MEEARTPFFSVVIPVYNGEKTIRKCVESILSQTFSDIEIIVVNDGSSDSTEEILLFLSERDSRVRPVTVENGGVFKARSLGARLARGTYLTYCDDDDFYSDNCAFEKLYARLKDEKYMLLQSGYYKKFRHLRFTDNTVKSEVAVGREEFYEREFPHLLSSRNIDSRLMLNSVTKVYHKSLYKNAPDPEDRLFMGDDMILNLYLLKDCTSAVYIPDVYYTSLRLEGSTGHFRKDEMHNLDLIKKYQLEFLQGWHGKRKKEVERLHHFETADWFFAHTVRSLRHLSEDEIRRLTGEVLLLPAFVRAREYFEKNPEDNLPVRLLLSGDTDEYIKAARAYKPPLKKRIYEFLKTKIIYKI